MREGPSIDLNADVGEGGAQDAALFAAGISSANIACAAHAGDEVAIFNGTSWLFDTDSNYILDTEIVSALRG